MLYSVDLSKATDRFPIKFLEFVLSGTFSKKFVRSWSFVMVGLSFSCKGREPVRYQVGNPMGAYSSWAVFALAHHFVVYVACRQSGVSWSSAKYVLLGDDILIGDSRVAKKYLKLLNQLDVEVSKSKTYISSEICEFAKRLIYQGDEITPFPISSVSNHPWNIPLVVSALKGEERKGYLAFRGIPEAVRSLQAITRPSSGTKYLGEVRDSA